MAEIKRIAMWSGPRNISTAMMRAWENRFDTEVVDEPFYACFLVESGKVHPMQEEILESQSSDWDQVIKGELEKDLGSAVSIQYQKHMTHHMLVDVNQDWFSTLTHAFLIRHPADVIHSYGQKLDDVAVIKDGFKRQRELFQQASDLGVMPPVVESKDILLDPKAKLGQLCSALGVPFSEAMLKWPKGQRDSDGVWAPHWYQNVESSTGFAPYKAKTYHLTPEQRKIADQCLSDYEALAQYKI